jgi:hypothetical protein
VAEEIANAGSIHLNRQSGVAVISAFSRDRLVNVGDRDVGQGAILAHEPLQEILNVPAPGLDRFLGQTSLEPHVAGKILDQAVEGARVWN